MISRFNPKYIAAVTVLACTLFAAPVIPELTIAVKSGNQDSVSALLQQHINVNAAETDGTTALHWAVRSNNLPLTEMLLKAGANANSANRYGVTPVSLAASKGSAPILGLLLKAGADVKKADASLPDGETLLMLAARTGSVEAVQALAQSGLDVNASEPRTGTTALIWAAVENRPFAVRALVKAGAKIDMRSMLTTFPHTPPAVVGDALEEGTSYVGQTPLPKGGWTALMYGAREGALEACQALAEAGADLNAGDPDGTTALQFAIINGHYDVAKMLVDKGADVNLADRTGTTPLYAAVDLHTLPATFGRPDLTRSVVEGSVDMVRYLLAHKANPNARLQTRILKRVYLPGDGRLGEGATPFLRAARGGDAELMRILLDAGANPLLDQKTKNNPIMLAAGLHPKPGDLNPSHGTEASVVEAIKLCLDHGIDINAVNDVAETAIFAAIGSPTVMRFLIDRGARLDVKNRRGQTPLEAAMQAREPSEASIALLKQYAGLTARAQ